MLRRRGRVLRPLLRHCGRPAPPLRPPAPTPCSATVAVQLHRPRLRSSASRPPISAAVVAQLRVAAAQLRRRGRPALTPPPRSFASRTPPSCSSPSQPPSSAAAVARLRVTAAQLRRRGMPARTPPSRTPCSADVAAQVRRHGPIYLPWPPLGCPAGRPPPRPPPPKPRSSPLLSAAALAAGRAEWGPMPLQPAGSKEPPPPVREEREGNESSERCDSTESKERPNSAS